MLGSFVILGLIGCNSPSSNPTQVASKDPAASEGTSSSSTSTTPNDPGKSDPTKVEPAKVDPTSSAPGTSSSKAGVAPKGSAVKTPTALEGWTNSTMTPEELAKQSDAKVASMTKATAHVAVYYKGVKGMGTNKCDVSIVDSNQYRAEYPVFTGSRPVVFGLIKNHDKSAIIKVGGPGENDPTAALPGKFSGKLSDWVEEFPSLMFTSVWGGHPVEDFVQAVKKQDPAATIQVQERQFDYQGHTFHQKKIVVKSQLGSGQSTDVTLVVDGEHGLPVTIDAVKNLSQSGEVSIHWTSGWDLHANQKFDPKLFVVPGKK